MATRKGNADNLASRGNLPGLGPQHVLAPAVTSFCHFEKLHVGAWGCKIRKTRMSGREPRARYLPWAAEQRKDARGKSHERNQSRDSFYNPDSREFRPIRGATEPTSGEIPKSACRNSHWWAGGGNIDSQSRGGGKGKESSCRSLGCPGAEKRWMTLLRWQRICELSSSGRSASGGSRQRLNHGRFRTLRSG